MYENAGNIDSQSPAMGTGVRTPPSTSKSESQHYPSTVKSTRLADADVNNSQLFLSVLH